ncbi:Sugar or nucleoside kinase, ribokinase family [Micromonospora pattaloongensis]|uniref:Sugar or nucleoside kinase, ribokinase family n=1 Tax=Micromonospora pattaloongensis TaxID=405436 RepID=A0A1H3K657_9ACTN|nr:PfkB family carbohydrate kinase [Micromonospora pattaloongensis]SDY47666.1 Sugar or nucleoside kinase, ribokinase family [Micromonospora pattaloongensis]
MPEPEGPPRRRIVVVGDVVTDVLAVLAAPLATGSDTRADVRQTGGGQAANTAAWLGWEGGDVTLVAAIGADEAGQARVDELAAAGVRCAVRRCPDAPTGTVIVLVHDGERSMITDRGANLKLEPADVDAALAAAPDATHLHLSGYTLLDRASRAAGRHALAAARRHGLTTSVDAASAEPLRQVGAAAFLQWVRGVDLLLANADEAAALTGTALLPDRPSSAVARARALRGIARHVVLKRAGEGAVWAEPTGVVTEQPAQRVPVVDATGAGDAFAAGLLAAWVTGAEPAEALRRAGELGAIAVSTVGARPPLPRT